MIYRTLAAIAVSAAFAALAGAGELRLKTRTIDTAATETVLRDAFAGVFGNGGGPAKPLPRRMNGRRGHWLIEIEGEAEVRRAAMEELERRGATILAHVPVSGYVVVAPEEMLWDGLAIGYRATIASEDKVSPGITERGLLIANLEESASKQWIIARFHKDVAAWEGDGILDAERLQKVPNASLEEGDRLLKLSLEEVSRLSLWDEIEFLFPAPQTMKDGEAFFVCGGVHTQELAVSMLAAAYGDGWDGPGRGTAELTFSFGPITPALDTARVQDEARRALAEWSRIVAVKFALSGSRQAVRNMDILFAAGSHEDPFPFSAGSQVLGHAFYPARPNPEPLAGDIHLNSAWGWSFGGAWDVYSVVLHEIGHSLGIGHTDDAASVMYPYYQKADGLKGSDIASIRQIYADAGGGAAAMSIAIANPLEGLKTAASNLNFSGSLTSAKPGAKTEYLNEITGAKGNCLMNSTLTTWSCAAVPLTAGENRVAVSVGAGGEVAVARLNVLRQAEEDVQVAIGSPAGGKTTTTSVSLLVSGTATHASGIAIVKWTGPQGRSGVAALSSAGSTATAGWSANLPLADGANEFTLTATARSGVSASRTIAIEKINNITPPANPAGDKVAPKMTIQTPVGSFIFTSAARMTFRGSATDNVAVSRVTWTNSAGQQNGDATSIFQNGMSNWSFVVNLVPGYNTIEVKAWDAAGNTAGYTTTVRRY